MPELFTMPEGYVLQDLKRVQARLLEMAKITAEILEQNGFHYFIAFGTLLGAVRHHDMIPWDDDFDMFLFDDEYEDALACLRSNLPSDIIVHDKLSDASYYAAWSKLRDKNSRVSCAKYPDDSKHKYTGINLDLYRLKKVRRSMADKYIKRSHLEFLVRKNDAGFFDEATYQIKFDEFISDYNKIEPCDLQEDDYIYAFLILLNKLEISDVFPLRKYMFHDTEFYGPNNYDAFLKQVYGDYMTLPEYSQRRPHCDSVVFL